MSNKHASHDLRQALDDDFDLRNLAPLPQSTVNTVVKEETSATTTADLGPRMQCSVCQWIFDPAKGEPMQDVAPGTPWSEVPDNFLCPECSLGKDVFDELASEAK